MGNRKRKPGLNPADAFRREERQREKKKVRQRIKAVILLIYHACKTYVDLLESARTAAPA